MGDLQDSFDRSLEGLPLLAMRRLVDDKLKAIGIVDDAVADRLANALMAQEDSDTDLHELGIEADLEFTPADVERVEKATAALFESMPELLQELAVDAGDAIAGDLRKQWRDRKADADSEMATTRRRLERQWGEPLDKLRMLVESCRQQGEEFNIAQLGSTLKRDRKLNDALARLHIRGCRTAMEILTLLADGYAEGARARWRTLFEISVTAMLVAEGGNELAERYLAHEAVDRKKALGDFLRAAPLLGEPPPPRREILEIERACAAAIRKYGRHFRGMYGWAGGQLGLPDSPQLIDMLDVAGRLAMKFEYRLACFGVHASARSLSQPLHHWDPTLQVPGVHTVDLAQPGADTAHTLVAMTTLLIREPWDLDKLAYVHALARVRDEVEIDLHRTTRRIELEAAKEEERALRRGGREMFMTRRGRDGGRRTTGRA